MAQQQLADDFARDGIVLATLSEYYDPQFNGQIDWLKQQGYNERQIGGHVGIRDTSEMLAVFPQGVRKERIKDSFGEDPSGGNGAATLASAAYGQKMLQLKILAALKQIARIEKAAAAASGN